MLMKTWKSQNIYKQLGYSMSKGDSLVTHPLRFCSFLAQCFRIMKNRKIPNFNT